MISVIHSFNSLVESFLHSFCFTFTASNLPFGALLHGSASKNAKEQMCGAGPESAASEINAIFSTVMDLTRISTSLSSY